MSLIKFLFGSLFSNQTIIDEHKQRPWWLAIIIAVISVLLAVLPTFTSTIGVNGSDIITASTNYDIDYSLKTFTETYLADNATEKINMSIDENGLLSTNLNSTIEIKYEDDITLLVSYTQLSSSVSQLIQTMETTYETSTSGTYSVKSMLIFTQEYVYLYLYDKTATAVVENGTISSVSDYKGATTGVYTDIDEDYRNFNTYFNTATTDKVTAYNDVMTKWEKFFDQAYSPVKVKYAFSMSGIYLALNTGIIFIMALTVFLLSRTKSSIQKYSYMASLKMICFSALSPAILALIIGYMISSFQAVSFVLFCGLRATWLAMKATSPQDGSQEPVRK